MTGINVTPLIDVLLVLFIVFLVIVLAGRRTLPVALPGPRGTPITTQILVDITAAGNYRLNGQPIPGDLLEPVLQAALKLHPAKLVFIRTAPERTYQDFITAADIARGAGATMVALVGRESD